MFEFNDIKELIIGIVGSIIIWFGTSFIKSIRKKSLKDDIEMIDLELEILERMKRSSVEMNRASFRGLYGLFFLFGLLNAIPAAFDWLNIPALFHIEHLIILTLWATFSGIAFIWWQRHDNLKHYSKAVERLEEKKLKKEKALALLVK